jgi:hypothetical protein
MRLGEKDWPAYTRGDEWFNTSEIRRWLDEQEWDTLHQIEQQTGVTLIQLLRDESDSMSMVYLRVMLWLARRLAGVAESYEDFKPNPLRFGVDVVEVQVDPADVDPPEAASPDSAVKNPSATPSTTSTPRSPATTTSRRGKSAG